MLPFLLRGGETLPTFSSEKSKKSTYFAPFLTGNHVEPFEKLTTPLNQSARMLRKQTRSLKVQKSLFDLPRCDEITENLPKTLWEPNKVPETCPDGLKSHRNSPILSMIHSSSRRNSQSSDDACFSENMSDNLDANTQETEISTNLRCGQQLLLPHHQPPSLWVPSPVSYEHRSWKTCSPRIHGPIPTTS